MAGIAASALGSAPALADSPQCNNGKQYFEPWSDDAPYVLFKNGDIEAVTNGVLNNWTLSGGAKQASGNEPYKVTGGGTHSLYLPASSRAQDLQACPSIMAPIVRLFAVAAKSTPSSTLEIDVTYNDLYNVSHTLVIGSLQASDYASWTPTPQMTFLDPTAPWNSQGNGCIKLTFIPHGPSAWNIDDLAVDPIKHS